MITIITGASHTGKTQLAQNLMQRTQTPYLSQDLLKMGLIRSGNTDLSVTDDEALLKYLWPITVEIIKTAVENEQDLIVEEIYVPDDWIVSFEDSYLQDIRFTCLVMSENYITNNFHKIQENAEVIEKRIEKIDQATLIEDNEKFNKMCEDNLYPCIIIDDDYYIDIESLVI